MKRYDASRLPSMIELGYDGENNWRPNSFDCSSLLKNHPSGVISLWLLPQGESQAFPVALERDGNTVVWTPLSEEMTAEHGQLQVVVQDGTDVGKSKVIDYTVRDSLVSGADHPAENPSWATQVVADVTEQADRAEEAAESIGESIGEQLPGAIADYLEEHPVTEADPTVPAWAKQPQKPSYTASEVGALPADTVIPTVPQMATQADMSDWTEGKTVDAATLKTNFIGALTLLSEKASQTQVDTLASVLDDVQTAVGQKANASDIPTAVSELTNDSGYQTAAQVQTAIDPLQPKAITDTGGYYTTDTVEGALQEIGAELAGVNTLIGSGVIT